MNDNYIPEVKIMLQFLCDLLFGQKRFTVPIQYDNSEPVSVPIEFTSTAKVVEVEDWKRV
jgi:hypothetical protein